MGLMEDVYLLSYVEDEPTRHVVQRIIDFVQANVPRKVLLPDGFPSVVGGYGNLKAKSRKWIDAAKNGVWLLVVTDMDTAEIPNEIGMKWLGVSCLSELPKKFIFRVAVREIESWIMADVAGFAKFLGISGDNLFENPDALPDPKAALFDVIRRKCPQSKFQRMLPQKGQRVGVDYNNRICGFVDKDWSIESALRHSLSFSRSIARLTKVLREEE